MSLCHCHLKDRIKHVPNCVHASGASETEADRDLSGGADLINPIQTEATQDELSSKIKAPQLQDDCGMVDFQPKCSHQTDTQFPYEVPPNVVRWKNYK